MVLPHEVSRSDEKGLLRFSVLFLQQTPKNGDGLHSNNPHVRRSVLERKEKQHVAWASERDNGQRGFCITGAHHHKSWDNDDFRTCGFNAIIWTAKLEVPKHGVKSSSNPTQNQKIEQKVKLPQAIDPKKALFASKVITPNIKNHSTKIEAKNQRAENLFSRLRTEEMVIHVTGLTGQIPYLLMIRDSKPN